jgi:HPt (histidine-containing phosphotransfer) domain-containing protein
MGQPLDQAGPIRQLGGNTPLYFMMLGRLEHMSINTNMRLIAEAIEQKDWDTVKQKAHNLKNACGYIGACRLHYACFFIEEAHH